MILLTTFYYFTQKYKFGFRTIVMPSVYIKDIKVIYSRNVPYEGWFVEKSKHHTYKDFSWDFTDLLPQIHG